MIDRFKRFFRQQSAPVTVGALIALGAAYIIGGFVPRAAGILAFDTNSPYSWLNWLTYPLAVVWNDPLSVVLSGLWLYMMGSSLEARWGGRRYGYILAASVPAASLPLLLGSLLTGRSVTLAGVALPLAVVTVLWCLTNPEGVILLGFLLPIPVKVFLLIEVVLIYLYAAGSYGHLMGLFALGGPALAYLYHRRFGPDRKWRAAVRYSNRRYERCERTKTRGNNRLRRLK